MTEERVQAARRHMRSRLEVQPHATSARFDERGRRIVITLSNRLELGVPIYFADGLAGAKAQDLSEIEISPTGQGLHWPRLDVDLHVPALLQGIFGSRRWMATVMGTAGGKVSTAAKRAASRANGKRGGRPRKTAPA